jgi:hypothetical protein
MVLVAQCATQRESGTGTRGSTNFPADHFELIQHALNFAEEFQMPVILLSDKVSAEQYV